MDLKKASLIIQQALVADRNYPNLLLHAAWLHKIGNNKKDLKAAEEAISLAKQAGAESEEATNLIAAIKASTSK